MDRPLLALTSRPLIGRSPKAAAAETMRQLVQLRWIAVVGQLVAILVSHFALGIVLPLTPMLAVVALLAAANLVFVVTIHRRMIPGELTIALLLDMAALTAQLYFSGGAGNPFISLYLLQVVLGAILLTPQVAGLLALAACAFTAFLNFRHFPLLLPAGDTGLLPIGRWLAFVMVAVLLVLFIARISRNAKLRDAYAASLAQRAVEEEGIVRMGLFASGAAHELGTPLSALAVIIADWERLTIFSSDPDLADEMADAKAEIDRCKAIVSNILHSAGKVRGEAMTSESARQLLETIAQRWTERRPNSRLRTDLAPLGNARVAAEPSLEQALWSLLENAAEASSGLIDLVGAIEDGNVVFAVLDRGPGFSEDQLDCAGRLYQSTKGPGHGLGLFLAANVARQLGGRLSIANRDDGGAEVLMRLPLIASKASE
jgi:two-component system sensor histidine kinase RegB